MKNEIKVKEVVKEFIYDGFGFPVKLHNVIILKDRDYTYPLIALNDLMFKVATALIIRNEKLSGAKLKFLRKFCNKSLDDFAKILEVSKTTILNWEKDYPDKTLPLSDIQLRSLYSGVKRWIIFAFNEKLERSIIREPSQSVESGALEIEESSIMAV